MASRSSKSRKSQKGQAESAAATLSEIESFGEWIADWVGKNPVPVLSAGVGILVLAAAWGFLHSHFESERVDASAALAEVQADFGAAMGSDPSVMEIAEPADPEKARRVRTEFVERYRQMADEYDGTASAAVARLEVGVLQEALEETDDAIETWRTTAAELDADDPIRALLLVRVAQAYEAESRWLQAAEAYEQASAIERYPLRYAALADAARCFAEAGEDARALEAFDRTASEAPEQHMPEYVTARMRELRARQALEQETTPELPEE